MGTGIYFSGLENQSNQSLEKKELKKQENNTETDEGIKIIIDLDSSKKAEDFEFIEEIETNKRKYKNVNESIENSTVYYIVDMENKTYKIETNTVHGG